MLSEEVLSHLKANIKLLQPKAYTELFQPQKPFDSLSFLLQIHSSEHPNRFPFISAID
jgi:hypothetical protein